MSYYRLELLPTEAGKVYYNASVNTNTNAGVDMYVVGNYDGQTVIDSAKPTLLNLGTAARMVKVTENEEEDVHFWLAPRSSIFKTGLMMANSMGIIDRSYRGTLGAPVYPVVPAQFREFANGGIQGSRLFQIVAPEMGWIKEVRIVTSLPETSRGTGGFGSTGR